MMKNKINILAHLLLLSVVSFPSCTAQEKEKKDTPATLSQPKNDTIMSEKVTRTEEEWKKMLSPEQYQVLREKGTERPFTGKYEDFYEKGMYVCAGCGNELFSSEAKFNAGCGWPSFFESLDSTKITTKKDGSLGMSRIEIMCARCGGHLGHVFDDGPQPTGLRYCVNSASLDFKNVQLKK